MKKYDQLGNVRFLCSLIKKKTFKMNVTRSLNYTMLFNLNSYLPSLGNSVVYSTEVKGNCLVFDES